MTVQNEPTIDKLAADVAYGADTLATARKERDLAQSRLNVTVEQENRAVRDLAAARSALDAALGKLERLDRKGGDE